MIWLTSLYSNEKILVNPAVIAAIEPAETRAAHGSKIRMPYGVSDYFVMESPEEIHALLAKETK